MSTVFVRATQIIDADIPPGETGLGFAPFSVRMLLQYNALDKYEQIQVGWRSHVHTRVCAPCVFRAAQLVLSFSVPAPDCTASIEASWAHCCESEPDLLPCPGVALCVAL